MVPSFLSFLLLGYLFSVSAAHRFVRDAAIVQNVTTAQTSNKIDIGPPSLSKPSSESVGSTTASVNSHDLSSTANTVRTSEPGSSLPSVAASSLIVSSDTTATATSAVSSPGTFNGISAMNETSSVDTAALAEVTSAPAATIESPLLTAQPSSSFVEPSSIPSTSIPTPSVTIVTTVLTSSRPPSALPSVPVSANGSKGISSSKIAVITGTILGGLISLFLVAFAVFLLRKRQRSNSTSRHFFNRPGHRNRPSESPFIWDRPNESDTDLVHQRLESISEYERDDSEEQDPELSYPAMTVEKSDPRAGYNDFQVTPVTLPSAVFIPNTRSHSPYVQSPIDTEQSSYHQPSIASRRVRLLPNPPPLSMRHLSFASSGVTGFSPILPSAQLLELRDQVASQSAGSSEQIDHLLAHIQMLIDQQESVEWGEVLDPPPRYGDDLEDSVSLTHSELYSDYDLGIASRYRDDPMTVF